MPSLSSVWNVKATSAGILARKLVSGLPSGSSRLLAVRRTCAPGSRRGCAAARWRGCRRAGRPWAAAVGGRLHRQDADGVDVVVGVQPASAPWTVPVACRARSVADTAGVRVAGQVAVTLPGRHDAVGIALALVQARRADQAERRPLRQVRRQLAVVGQRRQALSARRRRRCACRGPAARGHCSLYFGSFLMSSICARLVDRLAVLDEVDAGVDRRLVGRRDAVGPGPADQTVSRWLSGAPEGCVTLPTRGDFVLAGRRRSGGPVVAVGERRQRLDAVGLERHARCPAVVMRHAQLGSLRIALGRAEGGRARRRLRRQLEVACRSRPLFRL